MFYSCFWCHSSNNPVSLLLVPDKWAVSYSLDKRNELCFAVLHFRHTNVSCESIPMEIVIQHSIWKCILKPYSSFFLGQWAIQNLVCFLSTIHLISNSLQWSWCLGKKFIYAKLGPPSYFPQYFHCHLNKRTYSQPQDTSMFSAVVHNFAFICFWSSSLVRSGNCLS